MIYGLKDLKSHPSRDVGIVLILAMSAKVMGNLTIHWVPEVISVGAKLPECIQYMTIFLL
jgi:hypothetical protein